MRISDWSSDVCSSDLGSRHRERSQQQRQPGCLLPHDVSPVPIGGARSPPRNLPCDSWTPHRPCMPPYPDRPPHSMMAPGRSEEHTSELQSLMRISYAVFCLKKKKNIRTLKHYIRIHISSL